MSKNDKNQSHKDSKKIPEFYNVSFEHPEFPKKQTTDSDKGYENPFTNFSDFMKEFGDASISKPAHKDDSKSVQNSNQKTFTAPHDRQQKDVPSNRQTKSSRLKDNDSNTFKKNTLHQDKKMEKSSRSLSNLTFHSVEKHNDQTDVNYDKQSSRSSKATYSGIAEKNKNFDNQDLSNANKQATSNSSTNIESINHPNKQDDKKSGSDESNEKINPLSQEMDHKKEATSSLETEPLSQKWQANSGSENHRSHSASDSRPLNRHSNKNDYSLNSMSTIDKSIFSFNVLLNVIGRLFVYGILILCLLGMLGFGTGIGYFAKLVGDTQPPSQDEMLTKINQLEQQSTLYYGDGSPIANVQSDLVRSLTSLDDISPHIIDGIIATEDEAFYNHKGVVPKAILRAALQTFLQGSGTGGSTITQQLVKQQMLTNDVTFFRKANEILLALRLENNFSKDDILTAYLNVSPFGRNNKGENIAGIAKAAEGIFGVKASEVNLNQAAFLVGLPKDPYNYTPYDQEGNLRNEQVLEDGLNRMKTVLYRMYRSNKIDKETYDKALTYDIRNDFIKKQARREDRQNYLYQSIMNGAIEKLMVINLQDDGYTYEQVYNDVDLYNEYYFAAEDQLKTGGYKVFSTIDKEVYDQLQVTAQANKDNLGQAYTGTYVDPNTGETTDYVESVQSGVVVIENHTGKVLGFVAGTDFENNQIDHAFKTRRSPGSTIKPLAVYGPAIQENIINPASIVPDTSYVYRYSDGTTWEPTNYGGNVSNTFKTVRHALKMSLNLPTIRIYEALQDKGINIPEYLSKMGFNINTSYLEEDINNLAFSLGGVSQGPTVFEQTRAFSTIANNGQYIDGYYIEKIEDSFGNTIFQQDSQLVEVFSEDSNYLLLDILRETFFDGSASVAKNQTNVGGDWIAKTGISENSKDIWMIGSNPSITIGSWIGYDSNYGNYIFDISDGFGDETQRSQTYWGNIVNDLYNVRPDIFGELTTFPRPESVTESQVLKNTGTLPGNINYNGRGIKLSFPLTKDLFKVSNPAPPLSYDFMVGASENDLAIFWNGILKKMIQPRQSDQDQDDKDSDETEEDSDEATDEEEETEAPVEGDVPTDLNDPMAPNDSNLPPSEPTPNSDPNQSNPTP